MLTFFCFEQRCSEQFWVIWDCELYQLDWSSEFNTLQPTWGTPGGSLATRPELKPLALVLGIWPVHYFMPIIYLQTTSTTSGKSVGEGRLLGVCAELSRNLPFQLRLGLTLLILPPITKKNKIKIKRKPNKNPTKQFSLNFLKCFKKVKESI